MTVTDPQLFLGMPITVIVAIISGLVTVLVSSTTVLLTQRYASNNLKATLEAEKTKHEAQLTEQRADRLFEARREVASRCLKAIQRYKAQADYRDKIASLEQLNNTLTENGGELALLFSLELNEIVENIQGTIFFTMHFVYNEEQTQSNIAKLSAKNEPSRYDKEDSEKLTLSAKKDKEAVAEYMSTVRNECNDLTNRFRIELGTYEELPVRQEA